MIYNKFIFQRKSEVSIGEAKEVMEDLEAETHVPPQLLFAEVSIPETESAREAYNNQTYTLYVIQVKLNDNVIIIEHALCVIQVGINNFFQYDFFQSGLTKYHFCVQYLYYLFQFVIINCWTVTWCE